MAGFCTKCGTPVAQGARFCPSCGQALNQLSGVPTGFPQPNGPPPQYSQPVGQQPAPLQPAGQSLPGAGYPQYIQPAVGQQAPLPQPQFTQPGMPPTAAGGFTDKRTVLSHAPSALNRSDTPWQVSIEGDSIVARWKWMDATFFSPHEVNDETRAFTFIVSLSDNGTYNEIDVTENRSSGVKMSGGKLSFGSSSNTFKGKTSQKSFSLGTGRNNQTGQAGVIGFKFDTASVKQPIRNYLASCGWNRR